LHNTKITGSAINEEKKMETKRNKNHPTGRAISLMEMLCVLLGFDQVFTDIKFVHVSTLPKEERPAMEQHNKQNKSTISDLNVSSSNPCFQVRNVI
jgi:hypothetical protein